MPFAEKHVGYWLACLLPTVVFALCPFVLCFDRNLYHSTPPQGSVLGASLRLLWSASKGRWSSKPIRTYRQLTAADFWTNALPSKQVRRGFKACAVFGLYLLYWLCYNHISNNLVSQPATMTLNGVPNEIISNNDPLEILIFMPLMDLVFYPLPLATSVVYRSTVPPVAAKSTPVQPARPPLTVNHPARIYSDFREFFQLYVRRLSSVPPAGGRHLSDGPFQASDIAYGITEGTAPSTAHSSPSAAYLSPGATTCFSSLLHVAKECIFRH
ncbi:hypothetical protein V8E36_002025 [Tilletia maclaganii]